MCNKPWTLKQGFLIGAGLIIAGLALQLSVGPVVWEAFAWPANGIVLAGFLALIALVFIFRKKVYAFQFIGTYQAAIPAMVYAVVLTIIMGLTRQQVGGTWLNNMLSFWPFVLVYTYIDVILGVITLKRACSLTSHLSSLNVEGGMLNENSSSADTNLTPHSTFNTPRKRSLTSNIAFQLNHLGLFIALTAATLGNADMQRVKMICGIGEPEWRALTQEQTVKQMPIAIELKRFIMETYDDGSPKRFASEIQILTKTGKNIETTVDVNKPYEVDGWKIYQYGYDTQMGAQSQITILELVSDPWLPLVYAGFYMMLAGAVLMTLMVLWRRLKNATSKALWIYAALAVFASLFAYFFFDSYNTKTLVPALQSPWFAPHVFVYIFAYSLLGVAVVIAILPPKLGGHRGLNKGLSDASSDPQPPNLGGLLGGLDDLVYVSLAFLTIGMLFGALWAKEAWGHYWSWDPKETWAAITWIAYLVYIHYRQLPRHRQRLALWMLVVSFVLLQMCWWGINYLPSAQGSSVHTYSAN